MKKVIKKKSVKKPISKKLEAILNDEPEVFVNDKIIENPEEVKIEDVLVQPIETDEEKVLGYHPQTGAKLVRGKDGNPTYI